MYYPSDIRDTINQYIGLEESIQELEQLKLEVSPRFYAERSFTGVSSWDIDSYDQFQRSVNPEWAATVIVDSEIAIQKRIDKMKKLNSLFRSRHPTIKLKKLRLSNKPLTKRELILYLTINEIEKNHKGYMLTVDREKTYQYLEENYFNKGDNNNNE